MINHIHSFFGWHSSIICQTPMAVCGTVIEIIPDSKIHRANMGPTWVLSAPDGPHVGSLNLANRDGMGKLFHHINLAF